MLAKQLKTDQQRVHSAGTFSALELGVVFSTLKIVPLVKQSAQVLGILRTVRDLTRTRPDCLGCWLNDDGYLGGAILYAEQWESEGALYQHLCSDLYSRLLVAMEFSTEPPEIHFHYVSETKGMELIECARRVPKAQRENRN